MACDHYISCAECMAELERELAEVDEQGARDQAEHRLIEASGLELVGRLEARVRELEEALSNADEMLSCRSCAEDSRCFDHDGKREQIGALLNTEPKR